MLNKEEPSLAELIADNTKKELILMAKSLNIKINQGDKKAVLVGRIAGTILRDPLTLLNRLPHHEVLRLQQMVHSEDHSIPWNIDSIFLFDCLSYLGIVDIFMREGSSCEFICSDLAAALRPVIDDHVAAFDPNGEKARLERIILGLLNLYGILRITDLLHLTEALDSTIQPIMFFETIRKSYLINSCFCDGSHSKGVFHSPFMEEPEQIMIEIAARPVKERARFNLEEVLAAGELPAPQPPANEKSAEAMRLLKPLFETEQAMQVWIGNYWMALNNEHEYLEEIMHLIQNRFTDFSEIQKYVPILTDWTNRLPRWILQGYSSNEIFEKYEKPKLMQEPPQIVMGPNARKAGINIPQEEVNRIWEGTIGRPGRNDPCPCGSGKKYKYCCGSSH
jgi:hypothetical protein